MSVQLRRIPQQMGWELLSNQPGLKPFAVDIFLLRLPRRYGRRGTRFRPRMRYLRIGETAAPERAKPPKTAVCASKPLILSCRFSQAADFGGLIFWGSLGRGVEGRSIARSQ